MGAGSYKNLPMQWDDCKNDHVLTLVCLVAALSTSLDGINPHAGLLSHDVIIAVTVSIHVRWLGVDWSSDSARAAQPGASFVR